MNKLKTILKESEQYLCYAVFSAIFYSQSSVHYHRKIMQIISYLFTFKKLLAGKFYLFVY